MTQRRDNRDPHRLDGAHHGFLVERHQLFEAAPTAGHDDDIGQAVLVTLPQRGHQAALRRRALHQRRIEGKPHVGKAFPDRLLQIVDHSAAGRGDEGDAARQEGQRPLAVECEGAFGLQPALQLLDGGPQLAGAVVIEPADYQVDPAVLRVVVDLAGDDQLLAVFRQKR